MWRCCIVNCRCYIVVGVALLPFVGVSLHLSVLYCCQCRTGRCCIVIGVVSLIIVDVVMCSVVELIKVDVVLSSM